MNLSQTALYAMTRAHGWWLLLLLLGLTSCFQFSPAAKPRSVAEYEKRVVRAQAHYEYSRYTHLYFTNADTVRQEVQCSCLDSCSRRGIWTTPRTVDLELLVLKAHPNKYPPLLTRMTEVDTGESISYTYDSCLK